MCVGSAVRVWHECAEARRHSCGGRQAFCAGCAAWVRQKAGLRTPAAASISPLAMCTADGPTPVRLPLPLPPMPGLNAA